MVETLKKEIAVKIDSKGRFYLPPTIRKQLGKHPTLKKTPKGYLLISSKQEDFLEELRKIINSSHRRTGKPTLASTEEMKSIWEPKPEFVKETEETRKRSKFVKVKNFAEEFDLK
jgi:bifunctional DNA-binding transcriptional regulator/antitoxin component of YhaV-PrlF toxin-antitoxin module